MHLLALTMIMFLVAAAPNATAQTVYRWQDDSGAWHFSDSPPPEENRQTQSTQFGPYADPPPPDPRIEAIKDRQEQARLAREEQRAQERLARLEREASQPQAPVVIVQQPAYIYQPFQPRPRRGHKPRWQGPVQYPEATSDWTHMPDQNPGLSRLQRQQSRLKSPDG